MEIEKIIYETTRGLHGIDDKLRIATVFIFAYKMGTEMFANLLYFEDKEKFVNALNEEYKNYDVDFSINFQNPNVKEAFYKTLEAVKLKYDSNGFYKAVFEKDEYAMVIVGITKTDFTLTHFRNIIKSLPTQLKLF